MPTFDLGKVVGPAGAAGADGVSPVVSVSTITGGHRITITDANGTKTVDVMDGGDGQDGSNGKDGNGIKSAVLNADYTLTLTFDDGTSYTTPSIRGATGSSGEKGGDGTSVTHSWDGTTLTVTSASGTSSANLKGDKGDKGDSIKGDQGNPGADGVSPTVAVSKSGKVTTISITDKNGTKTATVNDGTDGSDGSNGKDGTSVTVQSVSQSSADGGNNVVTFSDGKTLTVKNGSKGSKGADGKTPVKGVDYWTTADQESIVQDVIRALGTPVFGTIDENCHINLTGALAAGKTYTFVYEDDGTIVTIGTYTKTEEVVPNYTNILDVYPIELNVRWSASGKATTQCNGMMLLTVPWSDIKNKTVRFKGFPGDIQASTNSCQTVWIDSDNAKVDITYWRKPDGSGFFGNNIWQANGINEDGGVYAFTFIDENITGHANAQIKTVKFSLPIKATIISENDLENLIITIDEPIV